MKFLLACILTLCACYVGVQTARRQEVLRTRRHFDEHRAKRGIVTLRDIGEKLDMGKIELRPKGPEFHSAKGVERQRVQEYWMDMEIVGSSAEVEIEHQQYTGQIYGRLVTGSDLQRDIPDPNACMNDMDDMINIAVVKEGLKVDDEDVKERKGKREVYVDSENDGKAIIVYQVEFTYITEERQTRPVYFIDACDQQVLFNFSKINTMDLGRRLRSPKTDDCEEPTPEPIPASNCNPAAVGFGGNAKVGKSIYGQTPRCFNLERVGDLCTMENEYVKVVDNQHSTNRRAEYNPVVFKCDFGYNDGVNEAYGCANDALFFGTKSIYFFMDKYGEKALPHKPRMVVHFGTNYENAFWDGTDMYFGDGHSRFYPLLDLDVIAHELAHGFTSTNSDLIYRHESGGINEAFSDITGDTVHNYVDGPNDWLIGADIGKSMGALRNMSDPPKDGRSIKHVNDYYTGMDVHYSSGIFNYAYYQMVEVQGMPIYHAFECFMLANKETWGESTNFVEGACGVVQACYDAGIDYDKVMAGFNVTGIGFDACNISALATIIPAGDTRSLKVSGVRRPITQLGPNGSAVKVTEDDVKIELCSTFDCETVTATSVDGTQEVDTSGGDVWVRLTSTIADTMQDRNVTMEYSS